MAVVFKCDRCHAEARPRTVRREEGPFAAPKPPSGWATVTIPGNGTTTGDLVVGICADCRKDLRRWAEPLPMQAEPAS